jgi:hypothetical protein
MQEGEDVFPAAEVLALSPGKDREERVSVALPRAEPVPEIVVLPENHQRNIVRPVGSAPQQSRLGAFDVDLDDDGPQSPVPGQEFRDRDGGDRRRVGRSLLDLAAPTGCARIDQGQLARAIPQRGIEQGDVVVSCDVLLQQREVVLFRLDAEHLAIGKVEGEPQGRRSEIGAGVDDEGHVALAADRPAQRLDMVLVRRAPVEVVIPVPEYLQHHVEIAASWPHPEAGGHAFEADPRRHRTLAGERCSHREDPRRGRKPQQPRRRKIPPR